MSKRGKIIVTGVAVAAVAGAAWALLSRSEKKTSGFLTAFVDRGTVIQSVATTGTLTAVTTVKVGSQVSGIIATLHADFNDRVRKGQLLATLDPTPFQATVNETKAQLERARVAALDAEIKLKRQKALFEAKLVSEDELQSAKAVFDQATAQVTQLEATLAKAETNLRYSVITAPIDGVVVSRDYDVGQTVAASFQAPTLFTIAEDLTRMQLTCQVDEADIGQVQEGQTVRFSVDAYPEREFAGKVSQIRLSPQITNNVVTYPVIVEVENRDLKLLPGMTADVRIQVAKAEDALRVPASALRFRPELLGMNGSQDRAKGSPGGQGGARQPGAQKPPERGRTARVYLPPTRTGGTLDAVDFVPGLTDGQYVEVRKGELAEGEKIVIGLATSQGQDIGGLAGMARGPRR
ncbi:MAG TPA: efflux RND transporter periplasmic adaptor subunit [Thermoanaerobaculaceae bacterium]|nr:efflux RND transporter periplasmic adaptor subunit [Thermoanaerobaculaceae bacterium]